jgi:hypothetical protein
MRSRVGLAVWMLSLGYLVSAEAAILSVPSSPYPTIQACADAIAPGDTCLIAPGVYNEYVDVRKSGLPGQPLTFEAQDHATAIGFYARGSYTTIKGFTITGVNPFSLAHIHVVGPGAVITGNILHSPQSTIRSPAIFAAGDNGHVHSNAVYNWTNSTVFTITGKNSIVENNSVRDSSDIDVFRVFGVGHIIRNNLVMNITDGPNENHIDFIQTFGNNGEVAYNILIEGNFVYGMEGQMAQLTPSCGLDNTGSNGMANRCGERDDVNGSATSLTANTLTDTSKIGIWQAGRWTNTTLTLVSGSALGRVYIISGNNGSTLTLEDAEGGAVNLLADGVAIGDSYEIRNRIGWWMFRNNVFHNLQFPTAAFQFSASLPYLSILHNTFIGTRGVFSGGSLDRGRATNGQVLNNIHVSAQPIYGLADPISKATFHADHNYSSFLPPDYAPKDERCSEEYAAFRFCEDEETFKKNGVNGGNPSFRDVNDPLGPDGLPFTLDDGLKPAPGSVVCGEAQMGRAIGTYSCSPSEIFSDGSAPPPFNLPNTGRGTGNTIVDAPSADAAFAQFKNVFTPGRDMLEILLNVRSEGSISLHVLGRNGHKIRTVYAGAIPAGLAIRKTWDGRNDKGESVASGVYMLQLKAGGRGEIRKIVVLK